MALQLDGDVARNPSGLVADAGFRSATTPFPRFQRTAIVSIMTQRGFAARETHQLDVGPCINAYSKQWVHRLPTVVNMENRG
jgi:hypothetical protein